ncbi:DEAD/DEAH box helicase [Prolixibacter bellariivorans]|uniref:DEAD/DEAH box helicase n=1 Tax=Prolixibacter bellariivorans TaxID=314319 RepID=A0A5M4AWQ8_9BACT|nr:DEAD/DEAH box helicase [Prolixibacter bellariivorans]GET32355.1 DEAD/DEAH box helicase [Prolixibacter bellariivorans]
MIQFEEMGLDPRIIKGIHELGFKEPSPIQEKIIPQYLQSPGDMVGLAQTGTGKTAAFGLPILQSIDTNKKVPQVLILSPTRELCVQIAREMELYAKYLSNVDILSVYGGAAIEPQIRALKKGPQIITATPGRMHDMVRRRKADLSSIDILVLDEADEMLNMGFQEDLDAILAGTPKTKRTLLFSATMPKEVATISKKYMTSPVEITVGKKNAGADNVSHIYHMVHARDRYAALKRVMDFHPDIYGIVFCRTRMETKDVASKLIQDGYNAEALHGDLSQAQRDFVMDKFRTRGVQMLVATDVAARGLDVNHLTHVINFNLPDDTENYTHRSGRTGRAGRSGTSISIIHMKEQGKIRMIEKSIGKKFEKMPVPAGEAICERQLLHYIDRLGETEVDDSQIESYIPAIHEKLEGLTREELIKHFVAMEFNQLLKYYRETEDLNTVEAPAGRDGRQRNSKRESHNEKGIPMTRFHINIGSKKGLSPKELISIAVRATGKRNLEVGRIDLLRNFSFVEIDSSQAGSFVQQVKKLMFDGIPIVATESNERPPQQKPRFNSNSNGKRRGGGGGGGDFRRNNDRRKRR